MRNIWLVFIVMLFGTSLWISGCARTGGSGTAERVIQAQPEQILASVGHGLRADGMRLVSRSDRGDIYETRMSADDLGKHANLAEIAQNGDMTLRARVSRSEIEFTSNFPDSDTQIGFLINLTPSADGEATVARLEPLVRGSAAEQDPSRVEALQRRFAGQGRRVLDGIAASVES